MLTGIAPGLEKAGYSPGQRRLPLFAFAALILIPAPVLAQADTPQNRGVVQLLNQVEALNGDISRLRGQIEVLNNEIVNAQKRQRDMYVDLDTRLRRIEQGAATGKKEPEGFSALEERVRKLEQANPSPQGAIPAPVATASAVSPPGAGAVIPVTTAPVPAAASAATPSLPPATLSSTDQAGIQRAYENAYSNYRINDYQGAIRGFDNFLKTYPKHQLASNAQYWIGESYFQLRDYRAAIEAQRRLLGTYPDSAKVPDALLIIGTAESTMGDTTAARKTFEDLINKYPATDSAEKAKGRLARIR